jgi:hypothetical protein
MSEYNGKAWVTAMIIMVFLMIALVTMLALLGTTGEGAYVGKFRSSTLKLDGNSETMTKYEGATLFPYSGTADMSHVGKTINECVETCLNDATCRGFVHHNQLSNISSKDSCAFYRNNNVTQSMGSSVNFSTYFTDDALVFGSQLPGESTDTYIKEKQKFKMFRSKYSEPVIIE